MSLSIFSRRLRKHRWLLLFFSIFVVLLIVFIFFSESATSSDRQPARPIQLMTGSWDPFIGPGLKGYGPAGRIVSEVVRRLDGYQPEIEFTSWSAALRQVERGEAYGAFPFINSVERVKNPYLEFSSEAILSFKYALFYRQDRVPAPGSEEFHELLNDPDLHGLIRGYSPWNGLEEDTRKEVLHRAQRYPTPLRAFQALERGEIEFLPEGISAAYMILTDPRIETDVRRFGYLEPQNEELYLVISGSEASPNEFLSRFDEELRALKKSPDYRDLFAKKKHVTPSQTYREARAEIRAYQEAFETANRVGHFGDPGPHGPDVVVLDGNPAFVEDIGTESSQFLSLPSGTRAAVLDWGDLLIEGQGAKAAVSEQPPKCTIKLLNGPFRGRVVVAELSSLRLEN